MIDEGFYLVIINTGKTKHNRWLNLWEKSTGLEVENHFGAEFQAYGGWMIESMTRLGDSSKEVM